MRVRLILNPHEDWLVESKRWYNIYWQYEALFSGDDAYRRARHYAVRLKHPQTEDVI
jgi:hypothetical protein